MNDDQVLGTPATDLRARLTMIANELQRAGVTFEEASESFEDIFIGAALRATEGNVTAAAQRIGVHRNTLHNRLRLQRG